MSEAGLGVQHFTPIQVAALQAVDQNLGSGNIGGNGDGAGIAQAQQGNGVRLIGPGVDGVAEKQQQSQNELVATGVTGKVVHDTCEESEVLPVLPLRGLVAFPEMLIHFDVGRLISMKALEQSMQDNQRLFLTAQRDIRTDAPTTDDLFVVGTVCTVKQILRCAKKYNKKVYAAISNMSIAMERRDYLQQIDCFVPLSEMFGYATHLRSATQGRGTFTMQFDHYEQVSDAIAKKILGKY